VYCFYRVSLEEAALCISGVFIGPGTCYTVSHSPPTGGVPPDSAAVGQLPAAGSPPFGGPLATPILSEEGHSRGNSREDSPFVCSFRCERPREPQVEVRPQIGAFDLNHVIRLDQKRRFPGALLASLSDLGETTAPDATQASTVYIPLLSTLSGLKFF